MSVLTRLERGWTYDELVEFTESEAASLAGVDPRRYEIVDGALLVNPSASMRHQFLSAKLQSLLLGQAPDGYFVCGPIDVNLHPSYRAPDLVAVTIDSARHTRRPLPAAEVLLALEIVSRPP